MTSYYERYIAGEYQQVWDELQTLGAAVRDEPLYTAAALVAQETMLRAKQNVETIIKRLRESGYWFANEGLEYIPASANAGLLIQLLQDGVGTIPLSLNYWYRNVGSVNLMGTHPDWLVPSYNQGEAETLYADPLVVDPINVVLDEVSDLNNNPTIEHSSFLWIAPDIYHKANISGGGPDLIQVPEYAIDGVLEMTAPTRSWLTKANPQPLFIRDWTYGVLFVSYLRHSFAWGGFPGFADVAESLRPTAMLEYLKEGLLPI